MRLIFLKVEHYPLVQVYLSDVRTHDCTVAFCWWELFIHVFSNSRHEDMLKTFFHACKDMRTLMHVQAITYTHTRHVHAFLQEPHYTTSCCVAASLHLQPPVRIWRVGRMAWRERALMVMKRALRSASRPRQAPGVHFGRGEWVGAFSSGTWGAFWQGWVGAL